jgi:hypothetical protein
MAVNYNDERFAKVEAEKNEQISQTTNTYNQMINNSDSYYQQQINASKEWGDKQAEIQNANTDFAIEKVNQAKEQAEKDYTREQKGAYTDYQKATDQYGVNAEQQAAQGLNQTGYSESTRTNAYNTYQNRYMAARESYNKAILNYDNSIKEAQLANNATLATIAYETLQKQLELSLQGFQYKNTLLLQKTQAVNEMNDRYYNRYKDVLAQINTENSMAEQIRQYNESMAFQKQQAAQQQANWEREYALSQASASRSSGGGGSGGGSGDGYQLDQPAVNTAYYQGELNPDAKNGTFANGYQPDNVGGKKLKATGKTMQLETNTLSGQKQTVVQKVWKTPDGTKYYWDGRYNKYIKI